MNSIITILTNPTFALGFIAGAATGIGGMVIAYQSATTIHWARHNPEAKLLRTHNNKLYTKVLASSMAIPFATLVAIIALLTLNMGSIEQIGAAAIAGIIIIIAGYKSTRYEKAIDHTLNTNQDEE